MTLRTIEPAQRTAAKVAGFLYLFLMATANFAEFYARGRLIVPGDAVQTATKIAASEWLFRLAVVSDLITFAGCVMLVVAFYVILKPINRNLALLARSGDSSNAFEVTLGFWLLVKGMQEDRSSCSTTGEAR